MRAKSLLDHVRDGTFRPRMHMALLAREALPIKPPHPDPTPAMSRLWDRLRSIQSEFRDVASSSVDVRHDLVLAFGRGVAAYIDASIRTHRDPLDDIAGLREIATINQYARRVYRAERDQGRELSDDECATVMRDVRRELRPSRKRAAR